MSYKNLFSSIECQCIVIIEDDFRQSEYKKERALYDITRMSLADRESYLSEIKIISDELASKVCKYLSLFDKCFDAIGNWNDCVPEGDIESSFTLISAIDDSLRDEIKGCYDCIGSDFTPEVYVIGAKYGIGVNHPACFDELYKNYIFAKNRSKSIRIYSDFTAKTQESFICDIERSTKEQSIVCIIDNYLADANRAKEIIQVIKGQCDKERKNIVGSIFSSKEKFEEIDDNVYFEYTAKGDAKKLESSIAKSAYTYFISELKKETIDGMNSAFDSAIKNKSIAYYLSQKAHHEGMSEYEIINDWVSLLSRVSEGKKETISHLIAMSRVINNLDDSDESQDTSLGKLNTYEAFDYSVNDYLLPISSGDIFTDGERWFVLIGQDCDMARRPKKAPRNALSELLPAVTLKQTDFKKWGNDLKYALIYNFRKSMDSESEILQVDYQQRNFISNEIINLCTYNFDGSCSISLSDALQNEKIKLLPEYMVDHYSAIQKFFSSVQELKGQAEDAFNTVIGREHSPRLISISDYNFNENMMSFNLRRVCRLTHSYVFYLYKLFLEYRGRQPFQSINLMRQEDVVLPVDMDGNTKNVYLLVHRIPDPNKSNPRDWCWIIDASSLNKSMQQLGITGTIEMDYTLYEMEGELTLSDGKRLKLKKARQKAIFNLL